MLYDKFIGSLTEYSRICGAEDMPFLTLQPSLPVDVLHLLRIHAAVAWKFPHGQGAWHCASNSCARGPKARGSNLCCFTTSCLYIDSNNYIWETMTQKEYPSKKVLDYLPIFSTQRKSLIKIQLTQPPDLMYFCKCDNTLLIIPKTQLLRCLSKFFILLLTGGIQSY